MTLGQWLGVLGVAIALYILWQIRQILLLVFTAVVVAIALNGIVRYLNRWRIGRGVAVLLTALLFLLFVTLFVGIIVPPFVDQFEKLLVLLPQGLAQIWIWLNSLQETMPPWIPGLPEIPPFEDIQGEILPTAPQLAGIFKNFYAFFQNTLTIFLQALLVFVLALMFLGNPQGYRSAFLQLFPSFYRRRADSILIACEAALRNWLAGILLTSFFIACLSGLGLWILRVDLVLAHALLAGLLNFIPNIGPTLSVVFPMAIALIDSPWKALAVLAWYLIVQQVESYFLTPTVMARQVSLLPAITLIAQIFFASVLGVLGLLLALPLTVVAKVWIDELLVKDILDNWGENPQSKPLSSSVPVEEISHILEPEFSDKRDGENDQFSGECPKDWDPDSEPEQKT